DTGCSVVSVRSGVERNEGRNIASERLSSRARKNAPNTIRSRPPISSSAKIRLCDFPFKLRCIKPPSAGVPDYGVKALTTSNDYNQVFSMSRATEGANQQREKYSKKQSAACS